MRFRSDKNIAFKLIFVRGLFDRKYFRSISKIHLFKNERLPKFVIT